MIWLVNCGQIIVLHVRHALLYIYRPPELMFCRKEGASVKTTAITTWTSQSCIFKVQKLWFLRELHAPHGSFSIPRRRSIAVILETNLAHRPLPKKISPTTHGAFDGLTLRCHSYKICLFFPNSQVHDCKHTSLIKKSRPTISRFKPVKHNVTLVTKFRI